MAPEIPIEELQKGVRAVTWQHGLVSAAVLVGSILLAKLVGHGVRWAFAKEVRGTAFAVSKLLTYGLIIAGAIVAMGLLGMPTSSLVLTSSALLVGVGFSLQHVVRDVVAGVVILVEHSIRKSDFVSFGATTGTVLQIGLRATTLLTRDGTVLVVPNHLLITNEVVNHSHPFKRSRLRVDVPTDVGESVDEARDAIASVAADHPDVLAEPPPTVRLEAIEPGAFRLFLVVWVHEPVAARRIASELRFAISRVFAARGIRFATNTFAVSTPNVHERGRGTDGAEPPAEH
jgi:potassium-dependent mechanosensitive channel